MYKWNAALLALLLCLTPFLLTAKDGFVALYTRETGQWQMTDTPLSSLPPDDQALLTQGIPLETLPAVTAAMEDFCS